MPTRKTKPTPDTLMTEDRMFSYVLWYTGKYRVSRARLREKLLLKGSSLESIEKILPLLDPYHSDLEEIRSTIRGVISLGKSLRMISTKLRAKGFLKLDIETTLAEFTDEIGEFKKFERTISRKIEKFQWQKKGLRVIEQTLFAEYPQFKSEIEILLSHETDSLDPYLDELQSISLKDTKALRRFQDRLVRRGFGFWEVIKFIRQSSDHES